MVSGIRAYDGIGFVNRDVSKSARLDLILAHAQVREIRFRFVGRGLPHRGLSARVHEFDDRLAV